MDSLHPPALDRAGSSEPLNRIEREVLERAIAKIVLLGAEVGVSPDQMILLLKSGLTVSELLEYLDAADKGASC